MAVGAGRCVRDRGPRARHNNGQEEEVDAIREHFGGQTTGYVNVNISEKALSRNLIEYIESREQLGRDSSVRDI